MNTMLKKLFFLFIVVLLLSACKRQSDVELVQIEEITMDIGFPIHKGNIWYDTQSDTELLYFSDLRTHKLLKFFTPAGELKYNICLKEAIYQGIDIKYLYAINPDTIFLLSYNANINHLLYVNKEGLCWKELFLDTLLHTPDDDIYKILMPYNGIISNGSKLYFNYERPCFKTSVPPLTVEQYTKNRNSAPYFLEFDYLTYTNRLGGDSIFYRLTDDKHTSVEGSTYTFLNGYLFKYSSFINKILIISPQNLKIEKEWEITSKYTRLENNFIPIKEDSEIRNNNILQTKGKIWNIHYDKYRKMYYVITIHEVPENAEIRAAHRSFSINYYTEDFQKIGEQYFEENKYAPSCILITKKGVLIYNNYYHESHEKYNPETKPTFGLFEFKK